MDFSFVHPSIAVVLSCRSTKEPSMRQWEVDPSTFRITPCCTVDHDNDVMTNEALIDLARQCDEIVFSSTARELPFHKSLEGLVQMGCTDDSSMILVASLLAVNQLESAIRKNTGYSTGRAPLLKIMLARVQDKELAVVLQTLLLPTPGLNLRNLLWHGCVSSLPRPWLTLILILTFQLEKEPKEAAKELQPVLMSLKGYSSMVPIVERGQVLLNNTEFSDTVKSWLSGSHVGLWNLAVTWIEHRQFPACVAAILGILLEHGLRQDWCRVNNRVQDAMARPGAYFVTLDGHGQRHQHNLLLHPYVDEQVLVNGLLYELGGGTMALLTDLFCSSCGGPNIRAALAHGLWDVHLEQELASHGNTSTTTTSQDGIDKLWDMVGALCVAMEGAAHSPSVELRRYRPYFSFTATTVRTAQEAVNALASLKEHVASLQCTATNMHVNEVSQLCVSLDRLQKEHDNILALCSDEVGAAWEPDNVLREHECNVKLAKCTAARTLLSDVTMATTMQIDVLMQAKVEENIKFKRLCTATKVASVMYSFFVYVALLSIRMQLEDANGSLSPDVLLKAVERSRMCVSTMSTFLNTNSERAFKAAKEYAKGKAVKAILAADGIK